MTDRDPARAGKALLFLGVAFEAIAVTFLGISIGSGRALLIPAAGLLLLGGGCVAIGAVLIRKGRGSAGDRED